MHDHSNLLLQALPSQEQSRLLALCVPVQLSLAQVLCEAGEPTTHAYFPTDSFVSLICQIDGEHALEVGMTGCEGLLGVQLVLGMRLSPLKALVQGPGHAWRIEADLLCDQLSRSALLRQWLARYVAVVMAQRAVSAGCLRFHEIGPRLARWLLMSQDRAHRDQFPATQEFLAAMLGVRRVGVTAAASDLQRQGLISYHRGQLKVLDRTGLEGASCACYGLNRATYAQTMKELPH